MHNTKRSCRIENGRRNLYTYLPRLLKESALNLVRTLVGGTDQIIKKALASSNLLKRIKKRWRARLTLKEATQS